MLARLPRFPAYQNKHPACASWPREARVGGSIPTGLLTAVPTGAMSGLAVLDIDLAGLDWLKGQWMPATRTHHTRSGGRHLVFKHREGLRNSQSVIAAGVDVRAEGGYVVWWPQEGLAVENPDVVVEWPEWLVPDPARRSIQSLVQEVDFTPQALAALIQEHPQTVPMRCNENNYAVKSAWVLWRDISAMPKQEGSGRGVALFRAAIEVGGFLANGWMSPELAVANLITAARNCGRERAVGPLGVQREVYRGLVQGLAHPYPPLRNPPLDLSSRDAKEG